MSIIDRDYMRLADDDQLFPAPESLTDTVFLNREQLLQAIEDLLRSRSDWASKPEPDDFGHLMACAAWDERG